LGCLGPAKRTQKKERRHRHSLFSALHTPWSLAFFIGDHGAATGAEDDGQLRRQSEDASGEIHAGHARRSLVGDDQVTPLKSLAPMVKRASGRPSAAAGKPKPPSGKDVNSRADDRGKGGMGHGRAESGVGLRPERENGQTLKRLMRSCSCTASCDNP